jgi:L-histidine N-alpha-methyltransferase
LKSPPDESAPAAYTVHWTREQILRDVGDGLRMNPKELPSKYFYDERGSELFEQITALPEYYLTRAERSLLENKIPALIAQLAPSSLVELGAGSASKTRVILDAMRNRGSAKCYVPIDVSAEFLKSTAALLRAEYPEMQILPVVSDITAPFTLPKLAEPVLIAFLGSTIGNFDRASAVSLLSHVAGLMKAGDSFLLGADLRKDPAVLHAAYNDSLGVTAAFNLNLLSRLNRELGANFPLELFEHRAFYSAEEHRIEMHLVARDSFRVSIPGAGDFDFARGESVRTELSHKYDRETIHDILKSSGMELVDWIPDARNDFALVVARPGN